MAVFLFFVLFDVVADDANDDGCKAPDFTANTANGYMGDVVDQPAGGIYEAHNTDLTGIGHVEGDGQCNHTQSGQ